MQVPEDSSRMTRSSLLAVLGTTTLGLLTVSPSWAQIASEMQPIYYDYWTVPAPASRDVGESSPSALSPSLSERLVPPTAQLNASVESNPSQKARNLFMNCPTSGSCGESTELAQNNEMGDEETFSLYIGSRIPDPTASQGPTSAPITPPESDTSGGTNIAVGSQLNFSDTQRLNLELRGGTSILGFYLGYSQVTENPRQGFSVYGFNQRSDSTALDEGERDVELPGGEEPWVHRTGGGVEGYIPVGTVDAAVGVTYQRVSLRDDLFTDDLAPEDELGNQLTVSDEGQDDLLTLNLAAQYDTRDSDRNPTEGSRIRLGFDQSIPVGDAEIEMTRFTASATQFIPVPWIGFAEGPRTLVLNVQGGHIFGDTPFYEAFSLGGADSVRGYGGGEVGTGQSYILATVEYRFPITFLTVFDQGVDLGGTLFVDYGDLLGTQDEVMGEPGLVRDKPGEGLGFGIGLRADTEFAIGRFELGISDRGDVEFYFTLGDRF